MSSCDRTGMQPREGVAPTLVAALAASFAGCFIFVLVFLCLRFLHLRRTWTPHQNAQPLQAQGQSHQNPKLGLDAATIALIPSFPYSREGSASGPAECAVCLSAVDEGETVRQLPACKHLFHQACVDLWLVSNASCPVCRGKAEPAACRPDRATPSRSSSVVPVEMSDDDETVSSSSEAMPERPGWFGGRTPGQEGDLERQ